jgi:hypothetical protein
MTALRLELIGTRDAIDADLQEFATRRAAQFFPWGRLPTNTVEQAIHEASLLQLSDPEITTLQNLARSLDRVNTYVANNFSAIWAEGGQTRGVPGATVVHNDATKKRFEEARHACADLLSAWWNR